MKISELNEDQKGHLVYRLDHNTYVGLITAGRIAKGEFGDLELEEVFKNADKSPRSAKVLAKKVMEFKIDPDVKLAKITAFNLYTHCVRELINGGHDAKRSCIILEDLIAGLNTQLEGMKQVVSCTQVTT